jgi:hypothetical protein
VNGVYGGKTVKYLGSCSALLFYLARPSCFKVDPMMYMGILCSVEGLFTFFLSLFDYSGLALLFFASLYKTLGLVYGRTS